MAEKFEKRVKKLKDQLKDQKDDFEEAIDKQENKFNDALKEIAKKIEKQIESQKVQIQQLEKKIETTHKQIKNELENSIGKVEIEFSEKLKSEQEYIKKLEQNVEKTIKRMIRNIENQKSTTDDRIQSLKDNISQENHELMVKIGDLKEELDTLKISYTINEKTLLEKVKDVIRVEVKNAVVGYEKEALMNVWIEELKEIINDFDKLKQQNPEEFDLHIKEIVSTIEFFRKRLKA